MPKVTEFPQDTVVGGAEKIYIIDGSTDKYATINQLKSILNGHIESIASLRSYEGLADQQLIYLEGGTSVGDGKQGLFRWDASSTTADDGENVLKVSSVTTGRWLRQEGRYATSDLMGVVKLATDAQTAAGTETTTAITPATLFSTLAKSHGASGYQKFPNGLILQWGDATTSSGFVEETFPETFPNSCFCVFGQGVTAGAAGFQAPVTIKSITTSSFYHVIYGGSGISILWFAIGY